MAVMLVNIQDASRLMRYPAGNITGWRLYGWMNRCKSVPCGARWWLFGAILAGRVAIYNQGADAATGMNWSFMVAGARHAGLSAVVGPLGCQPTE